MVISQLNDQIETLLDILDALYFFAQSVPENDARLSWIRHNFRRSSRPARSAIRDELRNEIKWLRKESGANALNADFVETHKELRERSAKAHIYIPKWEIERRWFKNFGRVIVRWPYIKDHAMVIYDPQDGRVRNQVFELEGALFGDAEVLLEQARTFHKGVKDFRQRTREDQFLLHTFLRTGATVVFHYLEAYLNGLAFDCLLRHLDVLSQTDHDLLIEWDGKNNRRAFVNVEKKLFRYPAIFAKCRDIKADLSACKPAHFLASDAKTIRDALTHPSPHLDREDYTLSKVTLITTITFETVETIFNAAKEYTITVEQMLFGNPKETAPWLFPRPEKPEESGPALVMQP